MRQPVRVVHYLNPFFAGLGGEEAADAGLTWREQPLGASRALQQVLGEQGRLLGTLVCGDALIHDPPAAARAAFEARLRALKPAVVLAGPAFASGRYGLACVQVCRMAQALGLPALTAMHPDNPAVAAARPEVLVVPSGATAADLLPALQAMVRLALKLGRGEALGPAHEEGYLPRGLRRSYDRQRPGYLRALEMLRAKLRGEPFVTEVPVLLPERVPPAPPLANLRRATIAMVTTGGLVRKGNPDRQVAANATRYYRHSVAELRSLSPADWEAYHAGYFNHIVNRNPNYILPLNFLRDLEAQGEIGGVHPWIYALPGVGTPVATARALGRSIAKDLQEAQVHGCLLVAT